MIFTKRLSLVMTTPPMIFFDWEPRLHAVTVYSAAAVGMNASSKKSVP